MCDAFYDIEDFKNDLREACAKLKSLQGICENALGHIEDLEEHQKMRFCKTLFKAISAKFERLIAEEFTQLSRHLTASI